MGPGYNDLSHTAVSTRYTGRVTNSASERAHEPWLHKMSLYSTRYTGRVTNS